MIDPVTTLTPDSGDLAPDSREMASVSNDPHELASLATEQSNPAAARLDDADSLQIVTLMNAEDAGVAAAVAGALPLIARLVDRVVECLRTGGRLFYAGAGTSGRLATLDAVECPPTFGVDPDTVQCLMAGGPGAWLQAVEGAEDDEAAGARAVDAAGVTDGDILVGVAASGRTPFVIGAVRAASARGCPTGAITNQPGSALGRYVETAIEIPVGPEVITGSTRLKAGTAQKMALNMISTAAMVRLGKVYGSRMVDVRATNSKLRDRARRIIEETTGLESGPAARALEAAGGSAKLAIAMVKLKVDRARAQHLLSHSQGSLRSLLRKQGIE